MIIDFHTHIFPPGFVEDRGDFLDDENFNALYAQPGSRLADHRTLLEMMERNGVDRAVCMGFAWKSAAYCERHNEYLAEARRESGDRLLPFMTVPQMESGDLAYQVRLLKEAGAAGIGEVAFYTGFGAAEERFLSGLFQAALGSGLPVCLHVNEPVGHSYPGKYEPSLGRLCGLIGDFPGLTVILSHWGGGLPFYELMKEVRAALRGVYYDTAASPFLYDGAVYGTVRALAGAGRILFGSDYPLLEPSRYLPEIRRRFSAGDTELVLGGNARRILGI